jgi:hypothetical protein
MDTLARITTPALSGARLLSGPRAGTAVAEGPHGAVAASGDDRPATRGRSATAGRPAGASTDRATGADHGATLAWERSLFDVRRDLVERRRDEPVDSFAEPLLRHAAATLGVSSRSSQEEVDRRFREIVKAERPDLGAMTGERLDAVRSARSTLTTYLQRARWIDAASPASPSPAPGTLVDVTG